MIGYFGMTKKELLEQLEQVGDDAIIYLETCVGNYLVQGAMHITPDYDLQEQVILYSY